MVSRRRSQHDGVKIAGRDRLEIGEDAGHLIGVRERLGAICRLIDQGRDLDSVVTGEHRQQVGTRHGAAAHNGHSDRT